MINTDYDLELDRVVSEIRKKDAKKVLVQLGEGLKPRAKEIQEYITSNTSCDVVFWLNSCYGKCDIPEVVNDFDLLIQFGH